MCVEKIFQLKLLLQFDHVDVDATVVFVLTLFISFLIWRPTKQRLGKLLSERNEIKGNATWGRRYR